MPLSCSSVTAQSAHYLPFRLRHVPQLPAATCGSIQLWPATCHLWSRLGKPELSSSAAAASPQGVFPRAEPAVAEGGRLPPHDPTAVPQATEQQESGQATPSQAQAAAQASARKAAAGKAHADVQGDPEATQQAGAEPRPAVSHAHVSDALGQVAAALATAGDTLKNSPAPQARGSSPPESVPSVHNKPAGRGAPQRPPVLGAEQAASSGAERSSSATPSPAASSATGHSGIQGITVMRRVAYPNIGTFHVPHFIPTAPSWGEESEPQSTNDTSGSELQESDASPSVSAFSPNKRRHEE